MRVLAIFSMLLLVAGCGTSKSHYINAAGYQKWYAENASVLTDSLTVNNVFFAVREYPYDIDFLKDDRMAQKDLETAQSEVRSQKLTRYALRIQLPIPTDIYHYMLGDESAGRAEYYAFEVKKAFKIVTKSNDTIPAVRVLVEQAISNNPNSLMLVEFEGLDRKRAAKLLFDDKYLSKSAVKFNISGFSNSIPPQLRLK